MTATIRISPGGRTDCIYTDAIDLRALGTLTVFRATDIRFNARSQEWDVRCASTGKLLHSDPSREVCLTWERQNLAPPKPEVQRPAITLPDLKPKTHRSQHPKLHAHQP
jgi:hypothetical protein